MPQDARKAWTADHPASSSDKRRQVLTKRRLQAELKHRQARDRWFSGRWTDAMMDEADTVLDRTLKEIDAELAALPAEIDWTEIAEVAGELTSLAPAVLRMTDTDMGALMRRCGTLVVTGETARMRYVAPLDRLIPDPVTVEMPKRVSAKRSTAS